MGAGSAECSQESAGCQRGGIRGAETKNPCVTLPSHKHKYVLSAVLNTVVVTKTIKT